MNNLRIRVVKLDEKFGAGKDYRFAVQLSDHGLVWWTVNRQETKTDAMVYAEMLSAFVRTNRLVKEEKVLWEQIT